MRMNKGSGFALLLIICGALILLSKIGFGLGPLMGFLVPLAMVVLGWYSIKGGSRFLGWILLILGGMILLSKLSWLIGILVAVGLIAYGVTMLKRSNHTTM